MNQGDKRRGSSARLAVAGLALTLLAGWSAPAAPALSGAVAPGQRNPEVAIPLTDPIGETLLLRSRARADVFPLMEAWITQANLAFCGVASAVMVLNSLGIPAPAAAGYAPYRFWTQDNLFDAPAARAVAAPEAVARRGLTLDQLAALLAANGVRVERWHGDQLSLPQLRGLVQRGLADPGDRLLVNYHRPELGQNGGGHISPLAAYDARSDRVLILDVARYRYPAAWVPLARLWPAIRAVDPDSNLSRGLVRIHPQEVGPPPPGSARRPGPS
jgi:hypothetical protein